MPSKRRPQVTRSVLTGLTEAFTRMEADDLTDLEDERAADFDAAGKWLSEMWQFFSDKKEKPKDKQDGQ